MECEFCKNIFKTKYVLKNHQKRAKYCLDTQKNLGIKFVTDFYKCEYCSREMAFDHKARHLKSCKIFCNKITEEKDTKIIRLEKEIVNLKAQLRVYKELSDRELSCIEDIACQPRIQTNNQTNNLTTLTPMDLNQDSFDKKIKDSFSKDYFLSGQKGVARFAVDNLLKDKEGNLKYVCTDPSRQIYRFKTHDGGLERDIKAKKLTRALAENLTKQSHQITMEEMEKGDTDVFVVYTSNFQDIKELQEDNGDFRTELASLTAI